MVRVDAGRGSQARRRMQSQKVVRKIKWACHAKVRIDKKQTRRPQREQERQSMPSLSLSPFASFRACVRARSGDLDVEKQHYNLQ